MSQSTELSDGAVASAVLTVTQMYRADSATIAGGTRGEILMENAGAAVMAELRRRFDPVPAVVLCGPGNNGGDGFVIARRLFEEGWPVRVALLGDREALKGDAALNAARWEGAVAPMRPDVLDGAELVIDAVFGAGLARPLDGMARTVMEAVNARGLTCVAVDMPSGVHGDGGQVLGVAPKCVLTVTFFRHKPGHLLLPGRALCGELVVADIGIPNKVLPPLAPSLFVNRAALWRSSFPAPGLEDHKYRRGQALVVSGGAMIGAARLAARGARRAGAGMLVLAAPAPVAPILMTDQPGAIVQAFEGETDLRRVLEDPRSRALLIGPGQGTGERTAERTLTAAKADRALVLDADSLSAFEARPERLIEVLAARPAEVATVLTPHEGEFARLFPDLAPPAARDSKLARARAAAARAGAVIVLKGADTVIAAPDGRAAINDNAPAWLATAGSGDVLAGFVLGLLAQEMPAFEAACAAVWLHGAAASTVGPGLIAEDLPDALPAVLGPLLEG